eukprot:s1965_g6.t1
MLSAAKGEGLEMLGEEEYAVHIQKHGSMKQIKVLAKSIARVLLILGLEPGFVQGAAGMSLMDDDDILQNRAQCPIEPNAMVMQQQSDGFSRMFIFLCIAARGALIYCVDLFPCQVYKMSHDAYTSFEPLYADVAVLESLSEGLSKELATARNEVQRLRAAYEEMHGEVEMVSDGIDSVHWGLVNMGGYSNFQDLSPAERQQMYSTEKANLIASRAMGMQRYLHTLRGKAIVELLTVEMRQIWVKKDAKAKFQQTILM